MPITSKTQTISVVIRWRDDAEGYGDDIVYPIAHVPPGQTVRQFVHSKRAEIEREKKDRIKKWKESHGHGQGRPNA